MAKRIKLTESQLKKVMDVIREDTYDQALETHKREKAREIYMSHDEAKALAKLAHNWCQDKAAGEPNCAELETITKKFKLEEY